MENWQERITINPNIRFGKPCIKGTRISVGDVLAWLSHGMTHSEIIEDFPELTELDILAALSFASQREQTGKILKAAA
ncbi:MAG: DUF433 domain-containing protein [Saprospiraceae bacterium]